MERRRSACDIEAQQIRHNSQLHEYVITPGSICDAYAIEHACELALPESPLHLRRTLELTVHSNHTARVVIICFGEARISAEVVAQARTLHHGINSEQNAAVVT